MHEAFKRIISEGVGQLDAHVKLMRSETEGCLRRVEDAKADMAALSKFAEDLPSAMLDKFSDLLIGQVRLADPPPFAGTGAVNLQISGQYVSLSGWPPDKQLSGRYRVIVILQKVD